MSANIHFTDKDWERVSRDWSAWWEHELERPLVIIQEKVTEPGKPAPTIKPFASNYPLSMSADAVLDHIQAGLEATRFHGDAFPKWWINFGPGIIAGFLGARVNSVTETVWFEQAQRGEIQDIRPTYDPENVWWQRVLDLTRTAIRRFGSAVAIGHTDLGGNLDIVASLRTTEKLLYDVNDSPDEVERLVRSVTPLWLRYYRELHAIVQQAGRGTTPWAPIWSPKRCYMLQCDFGYMISPAMFERFVMPDLAACCDYLDHGFYHLDGEGQIAHLDLLLSLDRMRGIQWVPGNGSPPAHDWLPLVKRIKDAGKLCQLSVTPFGARRIVQELGGRGFILAIREQMSASEAHDFLKVLASVDKDRR